MLYVVFGTDIQKARDKHTALLGALQKKRPDAEVFRFDTESFDLTQFESLIEGRGLFDQKYIISLERCLNDEVRSKLKDLKQSPHVFLIFEEQLSAKDKTKLTKYSEKIEEHKSTEKKKQEFNIFGLTDALGQRDTKRLWTLLQQALKSGKSAEEIHGVLLWQLKVMCAVAKEKTALDAGVKPFVYSKAQNFLKVWPKGRIEKITSQFVQMYTEARTKGREFELELERLVLQI